MRVVLSEDEDCPILELRNYDFFITAPRLSADEEGCQVKAFPNYDIKVILMYSKPLS